MKVRYYDSTPRSIISISLGICQSNPSLRRKGEAGQCEAAHSNKSEAYSIWNTLRNFWAENDVDACRSFAAVEWHDADRLLVEVCRTAGYDDRCLNGLARSKQQDHCKQTSLKGSLFASYLTRERDHCPLKQQRSLPRAGLPCV